ncbi:hypothetical protein FRX31_026481, partial [Thalictrum thalictroides]
ANKILVHLEVSDIIYEGNERKEFRRQNAFCSRIGWYRKVFVSGGSFIAVSAVVASHSI